MNFKIIVIVAFIVAAIAGVSAYSIYITPDKVPLNKLQQVYVGKWVFDPKNIIEINADGSGSYWEDQTDDNGLHTYSSVKDGAAAIFIKNDKIIFKYLFVEKSFHIDSAPNSDNPNLMTLDGDIYKKQ